jgi:aminomuconate-semialdehyde/2-hydroxymuconate-6-semialdehyde dehydrogenase
MNEAQVLAPSTRPASPTGAVRWCVDHVIDGLERSSARRFTVLSPIDERPIAEVAAGQAPDVDAAVDAARRAFPAWAALGPQGRAPLLNAFAQRVRSCLDELAATETLDNGSLLAANRARMVPRAAENIAYFARHALTLHKDVGSTPETIDEVLYDPAGVVGIIVPWNAPIMLSTWRLGPALAGGNTVVLKPAEWAPLTSGLLARLALEAGIPPGVFNVVQGLGETAGAALASHPGLARLAFTGSVETARLVGRAAAANIVPCSFELGGKSPLIVFEDADLDDAVKVAVQQYANAGQVCLAGTRLLVAAPIARRFAQRFQELASSLVVGDPRELGCQVGPLITRQHLERVEGFVERARLAGARCLIGGYRHEAGPLHFAPTLMTDVEQDMEIVQNEVFGPVLTLQTFDSEEHAIELANGTRYGLAASVFSTDPERCGRVSSRLVAGTVWVNCFYVRNLAAPFGGSRHSGVGREGGEFSFDFYCDVKTVQTRRAPG